MLPPANEVKPIKDPREDYSYSHDAAVAAITSYYELIERVVSECPRLEYPPPGGWPQITRESFASLGKTDAFIELLRHIPDFGDNNHEILDTTNPRRFTDSIWCEEIHQASERLPAEQEEGQAPDGTGDFDSDGFPRSLFLFAIGEEYGFKVYIDTTYGLVILVMNGGEFPRCVPEIRGDMTNPYVDWEAVEAEEDEDEDEEDYYGENDWRTNESETFRITTFFDMCREHWRLMNFMPKLEYPGKIAMLLHPEPTEDEAVRQRILKDAGWPGAGEDIGVGWDKEKATKEIIDHFGYWG